MPRFQDFRDTDVVANRATIKPTGEGKFSIAARDRITSHPARARRIRQRPRAQPTSTARSSPATRSSALRPAAPAHPPRGSPQSARIRPPRTRSVIASCTRRSRIDMPSTLVAAGRRAPRRSCGCARAGSHAHQRARCRSAHHVRPPPHLRAHRARHSGRTLSPQTGGRARDPRPKPAQRACPLPASAGSRATAPQSRTRPSCRSARNRRCRPACSAASATLKSACLAGMRVASTRTAAGPQRDRGAMRAPVVEPSRPDTVPPRGHWPERGS